MDWEWELTFSIRTVLAAVLGGFIGWDSHWIWNGLIGSADIRDCIRSAGVPS